MSQTTSTTVSVLEYGAGGVAVVGTVTPAVEADPSNIWDKCIEALQSMRIAGQMGYKSSQTEQPVARPGRWSDPSNNIGAAAAGTKWKSGGLGQPHVHMGDAQRRAVIGCAFINGTGGKYQTMNIYIGEEGK
jgi:hypothetical protein